MNYIHYTHMYTVELTQQIMHARKLTCQPRSSLVGGNSLCAGNGLSLAISNCMGLEIAGSMFV